MKHSFYHWGFLLIFSLFSVKSFGQSVSLTEGCAPLELHFTAPDGMSSYFWNFGDGVSSELSNPVNIYTTPGKYNVTFHETQGGPVIKTLIITVFPEPVIRFDVVELGCVPYDAEFKNAVEISPLVPVNKYIWVFGDGDKSEGPADVTHTYAQAGSYNVSLGIETDHASCNITRLFSSAVEVTTKPKASFSTTPTDLFSCTAPLIVGFQNTSTGTKSLQHSWELGNGVSNNSLNPPAQTYQEGIYTLKLKVNYANAPSCADSITRTVSVGTPKPIIVVSEDSFCMHSVIEVSTPTPGFPTWDVGDDYMLLLAPGTAERDQFNQRRFGLTYSKYGPRTVRLNIQSSDGRCSGDTSVTLHVKGFDIEAIAAPDTVCQLPVTVAYRVNASVPLDTIRWEFSDIEDQALKYDSIVNPVRIYDSIGRPDEYYIGLWRKAMTATVTGLSNDLQCSFSSKVESVIDLPVAHFKPLSDTKGCVPLQVSFQDSSFFSKEIRHWIWHYGDGKVDTTYALLGKVSHIYERPGDYQAFLVIETENGCVDTSFAILVEAGTSLADEIDFDADRKEVCPGEPVEFAVTRTSPLVDAYHFRTEDNRSFHCSDRDVVQWSYKHMTGLQDVTLLVDYNGCISGVTKDNFITIKGAVAKIDYTAVCSAPYEYTFRSKSQNATSLQWDFADGNTSDLETIIHTFADNKNYLIRLTAQNEDGCAPSVATATIQVRDVKAVIEMDSLVCINTDQVLDGGQSLDVHAECYTGYTWQFPTLSSQRPLTTASARSTFSFASPGWHTARLIVKDVHGCRDTAEARFKVYDMQVDALADDYDICIPATVAFTDLTKADTLIDQWEWTFGGGLSSTQQNTSQTYLNPPGSNGLYPVSLTVTDVLGCKEKMEFTIGYYKPQSTITATKQGRICFGDSISLSASDYTEKGSNLAFRWDFGNGTTGADQMHKLLYDSLKTYTVRLTYEEIGSGCKDSTQLVVYQQEYPKAGFETNKDVEKTFCADLDLTFRDTSLFYPGSPAAANRWSFGNGQSATNRNEYSLTYGKGVYTVMLIASTTYQCRDTASRVFEVFKPEGKMATDKQAICKGDSILFSLRDTVDVYSYTWAFGDGDTLSNVDSVHHRFNFHPPNGTTIGRLRLLDKQGCSTVEEQPLYIHRVIAGFRRDSVICYNDGPNQFTNTSINDHTRRWFFGDGHSSDESNPVHQYDTAGTYHVTIAIADDRYGCVDTVSKSVTIHANPVLTVAGDTGCLGNTLTMQVINPKPENTYKWSPEEGLNDPWSPAPLVNIAFSRTYSVVETDTNNCIDRGEAYAMVVRPIGLSDWDTTIIVGDTAIIPVRKPDFYIFNWSPEEGLSCPDCDYPAVQPLEDIVYTLTVTDSLGCFVHPFEQTIYVKPETFVKLPTTFTPNSDGNNDIIYVKGWGIKELLDFRIFNRWGQEIYSSNDLNQGWDGTFNGVVQASDVYVYKVKVLTWRGEELYDEGYINLLH